MARRSGNSKNNSSANIGFEAKLWLAADKLRSNMDGGIGAKRRSPAKGCPKGERSEAIQAHRHFNRPGQTGARQRRFGLAKRARRERLLGKQSKQSNPTTRRLAVMNLALRGIEADFGPEHADTFRRDLHPDLRADYVLATAPRESEKSRTALTCRACRRQDNHTPFNDSDWFRKDDDVRWQYGVPPRGNANFAWVQHFIHHLAPHGMAGFVLANGSMSSNQSGEGDIRRALIEADLVDCMVALPGQLFYSTQIPVCLWFLAKSKAARTIKHADDSTPDSFRERRRETLFIDARKMGKLIDRVHREVTDADLDKIVSTYHAWRSAPSLNSQPSTNNYSDVAGFCKSATTSEIVSHGHVLTPGRYVGAEEIEDDGEPFEEKMPRLVAELHAQFAESAKLEQAIKANMEGLGYGG